MKKVSILIALVILFVSCTSLQMAQVKGYADKGTRIYVLISDNQALIMQIYKQIQATEQARQVFIANTNPFTELAFAEELMALYRFNLKARELLKEINTVFKDGD